MSLRGTFDNYGEYEIMGYDGRRLYIYATHNSGGAITSRTNRLYSNGGRGTSLTGNGYSKVAVWDGGKVRNTHQEITGRITLGDGASTLSDHSTHVSGTIAATGLYADAKGMAYQTSLTTYEWTDDLAEMTSAATNGLELSNHSYGYLTGWTYGYGGNPYWFWFGEVGLSTTEDYGFGYYGSESQEWDALAVSYPNYLIVKSAGNDRGEGPTPGTGHYYWNGSWTWSTATRNYDGNTLGYDCITDRGIAKNVLTVGAVNQVNNYNSATDVVMSSFSGWGPTDDGRIKPDIVTKGVACTSIVSSADNAYAIMNGTSMAAPNVTGSLVLLQQYYKSLHTNTPMKSATLKGLVIHTADECGTNAGPDYQFGWGLLNVDKAALLIQQDMINTNVLQERSLSQGGSYTLEIVANGNEPLKVTICWTDPAATPLSPALNNRTARLVNDLDLRLTYSSSTYYPWKLDYSNPGNAATRSGENNIDNVEVVTIDNPVAGATYTITVDHDGSLSGGSQNYSLIISGIQWPTNRFVDGSGADWKGSLPEAAHSYGYSSGEYIYSGVNSDERTDYSGTQASSNNDISEVRFGTDGTYLYIYAKMRDITSVDYPHLCFVVTNGPSNQSFIGDDSKKNNTNGGSATTLGASEQYGRLIDIHASGTNFPVIELYDGGIWYSPPAGDHQVVFSTANDVIEARINLIDLGLTSSSTTKISLMTAPNRVGWNQDADGTAWGTEDQTNGVDVMTPGSASNIAWDRDLNDGNVGYYATVNLGNSALPVELTKFSAMAVGNSVTLNWTTATEVNNYGFYIETRNSITEEWTTAGFVAGNGNSNSPKEYTFTHNPNSKLNMNLKYRLRQTDNDGTVTYSNEIQADNLRPLTFGLQQNYPNPFNPVTVIAYQLPADSKVSLKIYDILGNEVAVLVEEEKQAGSYEVKFDATSLASGTYIYRIVAGEFVNTKKMVLIK